MEIRKYKDGNGYYTIELEKEGVVLKIFFGGNGDLYWNIINKNNSVADKEYFTITKENYEVFEMFEKLYRKVEECDVFRVDPLEEDLCFDEEERESLYDRVRTQNESLFNSRVYENLCTDDSIEWHSDDAPYGNTNRLSIYQSRDREKYLLVFTKQDNKKNDFSVEFSNSGSRYEPFNGVFMEHYNELCTIDPNYHQIHVEEILYQKRLLKTKKESK